MRTVHHALPNVLPPPRDLGWLRYMLAERDSSEVLNPAVSGCHTISPVDLVSLFLRSRDDASPAGYAAAAAGLHTHEWPVSDAGRIADAINLYNALSLHARHVYGEPVRQVDGFLNRAAYRVGRYRFSLNDLEHGVLRANRPIHPRLPAPFGDGDPRLGAVPAGFDPRIHFAINCGGAGCPPVRVYRARTLDAELSAVMAAWLEANITATADGSVNLPMLLWEYQHDFGGLEAAIALAARFTTPGMREALASSTVRFRPHAWGSEARGA
jgi:hypothetical protein